MNHISSDHGQLFLQTQIEHADQKVSRLKTALATCHERLEVESLEAMLKQAQLERSLLQNLLDIQSRETALSLDALLWQRMGEAERDVQRFAHNWHRGHSTPAGYWQAESTHAFLTHLMRDYHTEMHYQAAQMTVVRHQAEEQPVEKAPVGANGEQHPWYPATANGSNTAPGNGQPNGASVENGSPVDPEKLQAIVEDALRHSSVAMDHVQVIAQPDRSVILTGYAHTTQDRARIINAVAGLEDVRELLISVQRVAAPSCPICRAAKPH